MIALTTRQVTCRIVHRCFSKLQTSKKKLYSKNFHPLTQFWSMKINSSFRMTFFLHIKYMSEYAIRPVCPIHITFMLGHILHCSSLAWFVHLPFCPVTISATTYLPCFTIFMIFCGIIIITIQQCWGNATLGIILLPIFFIFFRIVEFGLAWQRRPVGIFQRMAFIHFYFL